MRKLSVFILTLALTAATFAGPINPPHGYAGRLYKGTFELYASVGVPTHSVCTATPYERTLHGYRLITAGHCVKLAPVGANFSVSEDIGGTLMPVTLVKARYEGNVDFAEFEFVTDRKYPIVILGDEYGSRIGDKVINPHFALGLNKQISRGVISSRQLTETERCLKGCYGNFLVQMQGGRGASGSVVILEKTHEVIGLVVYEFGENVGFAIEPISRFYKFLKTPADK